MTEVLDLFEVTHIMSWQGQQAVNTYTYVCTENTYASRNGANALDQQWRIQFLGTDTEGWLCGAFQESLVSLIVRTKNLYNTQEHFEFLDGDTPGTAVGQPSSPYDAFSFRTAWLGPVIRRGFKRFPGVPETYGQGGVIGGAFPALLQGMADALNTSFTETTVDGTISFAPCVVKRIKYVAPSGKDAYRLPENAQEGVFIIADSWQLVTNLTTQNSRKFGRGA